MVTENMPIVGALALFEAKPGNETDVERFFLEGLPIVQRQPASTAWYAFRLGPTTFGAFAAFANEEDRHAFFPSVAQSWRREIPRCSHKHPLSRRLISSQPGFPGPTGSATRWV